ncbi:MAG TPA: ABC transporter substrate-binding protein [Thermodesulfovibrionales bacterium]|nr:ABC transporter substrate-binding protein [Thermodesulfovibrionales bacterium]
MNRTMRLLGIVVVAFMVTAVLLTEAWAEKKIGILMWSEEGRYKGARDGIMEQLAKGGFKEGTAKFIVENAGGNKVKAAELAKKFAESKLDMIIPIGTSAAVAVAKDIKDVPIVFSMVYDPVESKIAQDWKSSGNNTTGASPRVPMSKLLAELKNLAPVKRLGVLYTPGEKNSEIQLKELQAEEATSGVKVIPVPLTKKEDAVRMVSDAAGTVDALYLTGSSMVGAAISAITEAASKERIITVSHLDDMVEKGAILAVCADSFAVGSLAGEKAAKVLKGASPSSVPIESLKKLDVIVNMKAAKAAQIKIPPAFMKSVTKTIQ